MGAMISRSGGEGDCNPRGKESLYRNLRHVVHGLQEVAYVEGLGLQRREVTVEVGVRDGVDEGLKKPKGTQNSVHEAVHSIPYTSASQPKPLHSHPVAAPSFDPKSL